MAKRRQTTGLPKQQSATPQGTQEARRERKSRAEREADIQRRVLIGTGVTVAIVVLILVAAVRAVVRLAPGSATGGVGARR